MVLFTALLCFNWKYWYMRDILKSHRRLSKASKQRLASLREPGLRCGIVIVGIQILLNLWLWLFLCFDIALCFSMTANCGAGLGILVSGE